ncbi:MAG: glutamate racemase [Saprospiraceae bacterium]|nr:glutamate racemase [Saprospiraceae bacterium]
MHPANRPIGIFDSGIGGLTVANAVVRLLPEEQIIYFGDTAHMPYGDKSADAIRYYSLRIAKFLLEQDCKMIVVACNSASSAAYDILLDFFEHRALFVNVVDPLVDKVAESGHRRVGVIATRTTINSGIYSARLRDRVPGIQVCSLATPLLAPMIEEGFVHDAISRSVLDTYLGDPSLNGIEALLLACTHYPLIRPEIEAWYQGTTAIYDSTDVVAVAVRKRLTDTGLLRQDPRPPHRFYVSDFTPSFEKTTRLFYGQELHLEHFGLWN